jgi:hypothetical protein
VLKKLVEPESIGEKCNNWGMDFLQNVHNHYGKEEGIVAIEYTAVTGYDIAAVFNPRFSFKGTFIKVTQGAKNTHTKS